MYFQVGLGFHREQLVMKRVIMKAFVLLISLSFVGCRSRSTSESVVKGTSSQDIQVRKMRQFFFARIGSIENDVGDSQGVIPMTNKYVCKERSAEMDSIAERITFYDFSTGWENLHTGNDAGFGEIFTVEKVSMPHQAKEDWAAIGMKRGLNPGRSIKQAILVGNFNSFSIEYIERPTTASADAGWVADRSGKFENSVSKFAGNNGPGTDQYTFAVAYAVCYRVHDRSKLDNW